MRTVLGNSISSELHFDIVVVFSFKYETLNSQQYTRRKMKILKAVVLLVVIIRIESLVFRSKQFEVYRPVVVGETVNINCTTDDETATLQLVKKNAKSEQILQPDDSVLKLSGQTYRILISDEDDDGEYVCRAQSKGFQIEKTLHIYIAGKVTGDIPQPVISKLDNIVQEGTTLNIKCSTLGTFSKLSWIKEGAPVPAERVSDIKPEFRDGTVVVESVLKIEDVKLADVGTYTCKSVSRFDASKTAQASVSVNVKGKKLAWLKNSPETFNAVTSPPRSSVVISCEMTHPAKKVKIYREVPGSPLTEILSNGKKYQVINNQELVIHEVSNLDYGTYVCKTEKNLLKEKRIQLFVNNYAVAQPNVYVTPKYMDLDFNAAANVTCTTYGNNVKVQWLMNVNVGGLPKLRPVPSEKILGTSRTTPQGNTEKVWTLIFRNVTTKDSGNYICQVTLDSSLAFSETDVAVKAPLSPQIKKFSSQVTKEDQKTFLNCRSKGAPKPVVKFFKDDVEILSNKKGYRIQDKKLYIEQPKYPDHDGSYTCSVNNMFGKATGKAKLTVTVAPLIDKSKEIIVVGGSADLEIGCNIKRSNPIPNISWEFQPWPCAPSVGYNCAPLSTKWQRADPQIYDIRPKNREAMSSTFKVPQSSVKKFFIRCTAAHKYGRDTHSVIGIIDKRDAKNMLKLNREKVSIDEKQSFSLVCTGEAGLFHSLSWEVNAVPMVANNKTISIEKSGSILHRQKSTLTITNVTPAQSGLYKCVAVPARTEDDLVTVISNVKVNKIYKPKMVSISSPPITDGEKAVITCEIDSHPPAEVTWYQNNILLKNIGKLLNAKECENSERGKYFKIRDEKGNKFGIVSHRLVICKTSWKLNNGRFQCSAKNALGKVHQNITMHIYAPPSMIYEQTDEYAKPGHKFVRNCSSEGNPRPVIWWERKKNGVYMSFTKNSTNGMSYLNMTNVKENHYGSYRCIAANQFGTIFQEMTLRRPLITASTRRGENMNSTASLVAAIIAGLFIIIILSIMVVILYKRKQLYGGFYVLSIPPSPDYFKKIDPTKALSDQINKLPYFPEWEFPRSKIRLRNQVGAGAFGEVYIAEAVGITNFDPRYKLSTKHQALLSKKRFSFSSFQRGRSPTSTSSISRNDSVASSRSSRSTKPLLKDRSQTSVVAVKRLKEDATTVEYKDLISEMKILIHIGHQENIVNLLGACTKGTEQDTMVILEFCPNGNLLSFMKERRQMFKPIWSKQHVGMEKEFTTFDLCVCAYQVAKGLDFLASRKCVHRDVAARNVLVGENHTMKVADFGLARDVYQDERYVKVSGGLLPVKWMAIEAIMDRVFTHHTDVWSYGVLLWELMTLGGSPYPGIHVKDLIDYLTSGNRMNQPQFCPNEIYKLMKDCWNEVPAKRPLFSDIVLRLARIIEGHCNPEEINLYLDRHHISGGSFSFADEDYLRPVEGEVGSFHYSPPPPYCQSFSDTSVQKDVDNVFERKSSERYVPDNRFNDDLVSTEEKVDEFKQATDTSSDKSIEPKAKMDEFVNEKNDKFSIDMPKDDDMNNNIYVNERPSTPKYPTKEGRAGSVDEDKDIDENSVLLHRRTPSPVEELSNFIDQEYEKMGADEQYVNT